MLIQNEQKFLDIKALNLPIGQYAITGSGPLGVRDLRAIGDIDLIVSTKLWNELSERYGIIDTGDVKKIVFPGGSIEAMGETSFYTMPIDIDAPKIADRIAQAEIINGLPFESLQHVIYYKKKMGREKDLLDIQLIQQFLNENQ